MSTIERVTVCMEYWPEAGADECSCVCLGRRGTQCPYGGRPTVCEFAKMVPVWEV